MICGESIIQEASSLGKLSSEYATLPECGAPAGAIAGADVTYSEAYKVVGEYGMELNMKSVCASGSSRSVVGFQVFSRTDASTPMSQYQCEGNQFLACQGSGVDAKIELPLGMYAGKEYVIAVGALDPQNSIVSEEYEVNVACYKPEEMVCGNLVDADTGAHGKAKKLLYENLPSCPGFSGSTPDNSKASHLYKFSGTGQTMKLKSSCCHLDDGGSSIDNSVVLEVYSRDKGVVQVSNGDYQCVGETSGVNYIECRTGDFEFVTDSNKEYLVVVMGNTTSAGLGACYTAEAACARRGLRA